MITLSELTYAKISVQVNLAENISNAQEELKSII